MTDRVPDTDEAVTAPDGAVDAAVAVADAPEEGVVDDVSTTETEAEEAVTEQAAEASAVPIDPEPDVKGPLDDPLLPGVVTLDPTGARAAFLQQDSAGTPWLWLLEFENGATIPVPLEQSDEQFTFVEEAGGPQWSPDGAFLALTARKKGSSGTHIRVVDIGTGVTAPIVKHAASDSWPRWSPDGQWIAFQSEADGRKVIAVASSQGDGPATQLTLPNLGQSDHEPTWDVKGGRLAFLRKHPATDTVAAGDHIWTVELATGQEKQQTKKVIGRHSLRWGPTRPLILHVTQDTDWDNIAVVNADNQASWTISSEQGDKSDPQWSGDGNRVFFARAKGGIVNVCDRATSAASSEVLDPGLGRAWSPRWVPNGSADNRQVFYVYMASNNAPAFYVQQNKKDAERIEFAAPSAWSSGERTLVTPASLEFNVLKNIKTSGLFYRKPEGSGPAPAVILLGARPDVGLNAGLNAAVQALAATGLVVFTPTLPGATGAGRKVSNGRKDRADIESEVDDLLEVIALLEKNSGVDSSRIAIVGEGYGGALALVLAGSRPDSVEAVVAIDPIVDWDITLDEADGSMRQWLLNNYGLPLANAGRYALRTPATFAGIIDAPTMLISRDAESIHVPLLRSLFDELDRSYWHETATDESTWATYARAASFLVNAFRGTLESPSPDAATDELEPVVIADTFEPVLIDTIEPIDVADFVDSLEPVEAAAPVVAADITDDLTAAFRDAIPEAALAAEDAVKTAVPAAPPAPSASRPLVRSEDI